jgi:hypothetical protein
MLNVTMKITKNTITPKLNKMPKKLDVQLRQGLLDLSEFIMERAKFYTMDITGPYSEGLITGKLRASIGRSVGKRQATVFQKPSMAPYGKLQETGVKGSHFTGWRPIRRGMIRVKQPPFHSGFRGKSFMARAGYDGRLEAKKIFNNKVKVAIGG